MAETSRSQVTITLGRTGQVVKRPGAVLDTNPLPAVGTKRSVRDRLGTSLDALHFHNKRMRGDNDNGRWNANANNGMDDVHLSKDDLRFKIMKRTQSQKTVDLREMLSQRARVSTTNSHRHRHSMDGRHEMTSDDRRRRIPEPQPQPQQQQPQPQPQPWQRMPESRQHMPEPRDDRQRMAEPLQSMPPKLNDGARQPTNGHLTSEAPSFLRNSFSPWTLDHIRRKSPDRVLDDSRGVALSPPPRRNEEPQRRPMIRAFEAVAYGSGEVSRPITNTSFLTKPSLSLSAAPTKSMVLPPPTNMQQRTPYPVEEHHSVESFLRSLGLEKYLISFKVEEVDMAALSQMGDQDLKELGIPMGPRKKILLALVARTRRQAR